MIYTCFSATLIAMAIGCSSPSRNLQDDTSSHTLDHPRQVGTPHLWDQVWADVRSDGHHRVMMLNGGDEALMTRVNLIRSAQQSIKIQTFIWTNDECGRLVMWELIRAARQRQVRVQILVDPMFSETNHRILAYLATVDRNLQIRLYNPVDRTSRPGLGSIVHAAFHFKDVNVRLHNKLMLVDDRVAITGGRNYANEYFDRAAGLNFKDRDVLVVGPENTAVSEAFDNYWDSKLSKPLKSMADIASAIKHNRFHKYDQRSEFEFNGLFPKLLEHASSPTHIEATLISKMRPVERVAWLVDRPEKNNSKHFSGGGRITDELARQAGKAKKSILIQTPYLVLHRRAIELFHQIRTRHPNLRVTISTNSLAATDNWMAYAGTYKQKRILLQDLGMELWEFKPAPADIGQMMAYQRALHLKPSSERSDPRRKDMPRLCLHSKSMVIDERISIVGSYNFDPRSGNLTTEIGLLIEDEAFAQALASNIRRDMAPRNSYYSAPRRRIASIGRANVWAHRVSESLPLDAWPVRYATNFELRDGGLPVSGTHPDFYRHWRDAGCFPQVNPIGQKRIGSWFIKVLGKAFIPVL